jgi:FkbM family methyltransferase
MIRSLLFAAVYHESAFWRGVTRLLLGRDATVSFKRVMLFNHFLYKSYGKIIQISDRECLVTDREYCVIAPLQEIWILDEVKRVYLQPKPGDVVIDAGAHYGFYSLLASRLVEDKGLVLSFEPAPINYQRLLTNIKINNACNVKAFKMALGDKDGRAKLFLSKATGTHSIITPKISEKYENTVNVRMRKIDTMVQELVLKRVDLIKIDTEGAELMILKGARQTLTKFKPKLTIAAYHTPGEAEKIAYWLKQIVPSYEIIIKRDPFSLHSFYLHAMVDNK